MTMSHDEYNARSLDATLSRLETKLDSALEALEQYDQRLNFLENAENKRLGAMIAVGTICGAIGTAATFAVEFLKGK